MELGKTKVGKVKQKVRKYDKRRSIENMVACYTYGG